MEDDEGILIRDDLRQLIKALPSDLHQTLLSHPHRSDLLEVILDLGRRPEARFQGQRGGQILREAEISMEDLQAAENAVGSFGQDNRAGIPGTLHRISAIRNRKGAVVGMTMRVGRAVSGHAELIRDLVEANQSILLVGKPGVGKTTVIREISRLLSCDLGKRVVIVDTSNEIGGDGDVAHPAIGNARRMQVPDATRQAATMIEAVENHTPQVIIVDEIGTEAESLACRTIAERGIVLIGTAHGKVIDNLMNNPSLTDLVGGIQSVTLGDESAKARGTKKSVLERKAPPTFPILIELRERNKYVAHWTSDSVDALLLGKQPMVQVRERDPKTHQVVIKNTSYAQVEPKAPSNPAIDEASLVKEFV
jgi:stage III sporulation protein AA